MDQHVTVADFKTFEYTFKQALQAIYFNSDNGLKSAMLNVVKQTLGNGVRSCRAPAVSKAETCSLVLTKAVADTIVESVLSNTGRDSSSRTARQLQ